ncbi:flagellin N-terminal helical domain-containing protein, partial [Anaerobiospirillum succiniciproducens]
MALYVNTNVSSINAQRKLANSTLALHTSYQRLSSGLRINSSKDDAAGLQISDRLTSQINGLNQGNRNANDGIALAQTIEGALDEQTNMLQRIRTLAVQAANGTNTAKDRQALQEEVTSLSHEITRIAKKTTFAGALVLDGAGGNTLTREKKITVGGQQVTSGEYFFQVGANSMDEITMDTRGFKISNALSAMNANKWQVGGQDIGDNYSKVGLITKFGGQAVFSNARFSVSTASMAQATLANIDKFIEYV